MHCYYKATKNGKSACVRAHRLTYTVAESRMIDNPMRAETFALSGLTDSKFTEALSKKSPTATKLFFQRSLDGAWCNTGLTCNIIRRMNLAYI